MKQFLAVCLILCCGCVVGPIDRPNKPDDPVKPDPSPTPIVKQLVPEAVFAALADDIAAGHLTSSVRLGQVVLTLHREAKLDAAAFAAFGAAFPGISTERPLDKDDAIKLRTLK